MSHYSVAEIASYAQHLNCHVHVFAHQLKGLYEAKTRLRARYSTLQFLPPRLRHFFSAVIHEAGNIALLPPN